MENDKNHSFLQIEDGLKKEWIEKAFDFFNKKLYIYRDFEEDLDGETRIFEFLTCDYDTTDEFNEAFKKHMEQ